jgi:hypothetical protein
VHKIREHDLRQSRVIALFQDRALSFILAKGATLEDLSDRLTNLDWQHSDSPVAITVTFGSSSRQAGSPPSQVSCVALHQPALSA